MGGITPIRPADTPPVSPVFPSANSGAVRAEPVEGLARHADRSGAPRYWAFLSYSHHDKLIAKRLQRQLETYRVPRRLVGRETSHGPVPARVTPVFRDRDELHAGADLKASVQDALSKSRWLIVVCTPDAARSPWVNREIIEFKRLHGERRVLALIARGEPFASDMPERQAEECFPPALRRALNEDGLPEGEPLEPIAADMRKHGDGPQRAMLKLLAGMVGVGFDDLVRRDVQRRVRWLTAVAGASLVGVLGFAVLAVMAVQARDEAQHQRVQAEGLIEFMLGDLRKKLEPVGRLEVLDSVGEKALAYYGGQEAGRLDATALGHRARAMHLIGEMRDLRGNLAEAQAVFEQAATTTAELLEKSPGDGQRIFDHAQSVFWVGHLAWKRGDASAAERWWQQYLVLANRLHAIDESNPDWLAELAFAHMNLGTLQLGTRRPDDALKSFVLAHGIFVRVVSAKSGMAQELANVLGWSAVARAKLGDYRGALTDQQRQLAILRSIPGGAKNRSVQRGILQSLILVSSYQLALGNVVEAEAAASDSIRIAEDLVGVDPTNLFWKSNACIARLRQVEVLMFLGRRSEAESAFDKSAGCAGSFDPAGSMGVLQAVRIEGRTLALLASMDRGGSLVENSIQFLERSTRLLKDNMLDRESLSIELANTTVALGHLQVWRQTDAGRNTWQDVQALLAPYSESREGAILTPLAKAHLMLGDVRGASALIDRIESTSYRHPAYAGLVKELHAAQGGGSSAFTGEKK